MATTNHSDNKIKLVVVSSSSDLAFKHTVTSSKYSPEVWNLIIK